MGKDNSEKQGKRGLFSWFGKKVKEVPDEAQENTPQKPAGLPVPPGEQPPPEVEEPEEVLETELLAKDSQLYGVYCRINGMPPLPDDATYNAAVFHAPGLLPSEETLQLLKKLDRNAVLMLERWNEAEAEPVNAEAAVLVNGNKMQVYLFAFPPMFGGEELSIEGVNAILEREKITYGIDHDALQNAVEQGTYMRLVPIATGKPPVDGTDGWIKDHFSRQWEMRLTVREDNTIDYRDLGWLQTVLAGEVICDIIPPTEAENGSNVFGNELRGRDGRKAVVPKGNNTEINEEGTALLSKIDGVVTFQSERFRVEPLLIIEGHVDIAVGHLDVVGDVLIKGDVQEGFKVKATGDITVNGGVEGAFLDAGGTVQIGLGMNGNSVGKITAGREVYSKFFENTTVKATGNIVCDTIINSDIASEGEVLVTTGRGAIIGGSVTALKRIVATTVGNPSNRAIEITLGNTGAYLQEKKNLEEARQAQAMELNELEKDIKFLERQTDTPQNRERLNEANLQMKMGRLKLSKLNAEYQKLIEREADIAKCRLQAEVLYPPIAISVGSAIKNIRENVYNAMVYYKDGEIHVANV